VPGAEGGWRIVHSCTPTSARTGQIDVAARDDGHDLAAAGAPAARGGDGTSGGAFGDDMRALGGHFDGIGHLVQRHHDRTVEVPHERHIVSSTDFPPAPSTTTRASRRTTPAVQRQATR